jgi:hypothetical protein
MKKGAKMERNKEQIKSDLENCKFGKDKPICEGCNYKPWIKPICFGLLCNKALALITSQEQRIKELEQCLEHEHASAMEIFGQWSEKCERLTEENERLENALIEQSAENVMLIGENKRLRACTNLVPTLNEVKADTVSNLKSRMAIQFGTYTGKDTIPIKELFDVLDKVCEEILDEDHD